MNKCKNTNCFWCVQDLCKIQNIELDEKGQCISFYDRNKIQEKLKEDEDSNIR